MANTELLQRQRDLCEPSTAKGKRPGLGSSDDQAQLFTC